MEPFYDDFSEMSYTKNNTIIFSDESLREFFLSDLSREETELTFLFALNREDPTYKACKLYLERKKRRRTRCCKFLRKIKK